MSAVPAIGLLAFGVHDLPLVNALLNGTATVLLLIAYVQIKRGQENAHRKTMLYAFGVSIAFLISYLVYHAFAGSVKFTGPQPVRAIYLAILISHVILAASVPVLAILSIWLGLSDRRAAHRRLSKWTFPIWLYVSVTGVIIYVMLYQVYPPPPEGAPRVAMKSQDSR